MRPLDPPNNPTPGILDSIRGFLRRVDARVRAFLAGTDVGR